MNCINNHNYKFMKRLTLTFLGIITVAAAAFAQKPDKNELNYKIP